MLHPVESLPYGLGEPLGQARLRVQAEDFVVDEDLGFEPEGEGEHVFLHICRSGLTTRDVARRLSSHAGVREMAVGYAGMKDRHARSSQWFSVQIPGKDMPGWQVLESAELQVLNVARHPRKLRRGQHRGNRFILRLRDFCVAPALLEQRLQAMAEAGVPNYFGEQRFGNAGDNVQQALEMFRGKHVRRGPLRGLLLSAARSFLFNEVLAERVRRGSWNQLLSGDVLMLPVEGRLLGDRSLPTTREQAYADGLVDASGVLWGQGDLLTVGEMRDIEQGIAAAHEELARGLEQAELGQQRRPLRLRPGDLGWEFDGEQLELRFGLPVGSYATSVVREIARDDKVPAPRKEEH